MSDDIIIPRSDLDGELSYRWANLTKSNARDERLACNVPDTMTLAEWHYFNALASLAAAVEMKRLGF